MSDDTPEPPAGGSGKGRLAGLLFLLLGGGLTAVNYAFNARMGGFFVMAAWLGPFCAALGLGCLIEGPEIPVRKLSPLLGGFALVGAIAGIVNYFVLKGMMG